MHVLVITGSWSQLKMKTGPQKLMLTTFPFVTDSFFNPPRVHDMQLKPKKKTKQKKPSPQNRCEGCFFPHHHGLSKKAVTNLARQQAEPCRISEYQKL